MEYKHRQKKREKKCWRDKTQGKRLKKSTIELGGGEQEKKGIK